VSFCQSESGAGKKNEIRLGFVTLPELSGICFLEILDTKFEKVKKKHVMDIGARIA
jgi:hypothetical protein